MMSNDHWFSSKKQDWTTPLDFFLELKNEFNFTWDLACYRQNCLCENGFYHDEGFDSLKEEWHKLDGWLWCNPPYGREISNFVEKACEESKLGAKIVMLIPARTDTSYWHKFIFGHAEIKFLRGRLKFGGASGRAPFPSALVIYGRSH